MKISDKGLQFIQHNERLRLKAYKPTPTDKWTIGYGHTMGVYQGQTITPYEADEMLRDDLIIVERCIDRSVTYGLSQCQYDAICDLIFNVGCSSWRQSNALWFLNEGDIDRFIDQAFSKEHGWTKQGGKTLDGLVHRRAQEQILFLTGHYANVG